MANMSYCRFENTYLDLKDCYKAMRNGTDDLSENEKEFHNQMLELCKKIVNDFGENEQEDNE